MKENKNTFEQVLLTGYYWEFTSRTQVWQFDIHNHRVLLLYVHTIYCSFIHCLGWVFDIDTIHCSFIHCLGWIFNIHTIHCSFIHCIRWVFDIYTIHCSFIHCIRWVFDIHTIRCSFITMLSLQKSCFKFAQRSEF